MHTANNSSTPFARLLPFITAGSATFTGNITAGNITANNNLAVTGTTTLTNTFTSAANSFFSQSIAVTNNVISTGGSIYSAANFNISSRLQLATSADGAAWVTNSAGTGLTSLTLGVSGSASYPMFLTPGSARALR